MLPRAQNYLHDGHLHDLPQKRQGELWDELFNHPISERGMEWKGGGSVFAGFDSYDYGDRWLGFDAARGPGDRGWVGLVPEDWQAKANKAESPSAHSSATSNTASILRVEKDQTKTIVIADATGKKLAEIKVVGEATVYVE